MAKETKKRLELKLKFLQETLQEVEESIQRVENMKDEGEYSSSEVIDLREKYLPKLNEIREKTLRAIDLAQEDIANLKRKK